MYRLRLNVISQRVNCLYAAQFRAVCWNLRGKCLGVGRRAVSAVSTVTVTVPPALDAATPRSSPLKLVVRGAESRMRSVIHGPDGGTWISLIGHEIGFERRDGPRCSDVKP